MPAVPRSLSSIVSGVTFDLDAFPSSASVAHPWWNGDEYSPAASTNAVDLGLDTQSAGAITVDPAAVRRGGLWARVVRAIPAFAIRKAVRRSSASSGSSGKSSAAKYAARRCPYAVCNHAVCNA